jgi:hypothetical protein
MLGDLEDLTLRHDLGHDRGELRFGFKYPNASH